MYAMTGRYFFAGHIPKVTTTGHSIFAPKQHKNSLNSANRTRQALMYIFSKNMFRLGAQFLWPVPVTCRMWPVKETRLATTVFNSNGNTYLRLRRAWSFHVVVLQRTAKQCTNIFIRTCSEIVLLMTPFAKARFIRRLSAVSNSIQRIKFDRN